MDYNISKDLIAIREILELTQEEMAKKIGAGQITISRNELERTNISAKTMEKVYDFAYRQNIKLNKLKEMFWKESLEGSNKLLFHGAKGAIEGKINTSSGRLNNDFGQGFYVGESYEQAVSFIAGFDKSSVYYLQFNDQNLKCKKYEVNLDWMLTIAYYRETLEDYKDKKIIKKLIEESRDCDYIIAPIADNRMFQIINSFIAGEITDEQCKHCLAATNLGLQYVFISDKAINNLTMLERYYISESEKEYYKKIKSSETKLGDDKVKLARIRYRGKGKYIDEILG